MQFTQQGMKRKAFGLGRKEGEGGEFANLLPCCDVLSREDLRGKQGIVKRTILKSANEMTEEFKWKKMCKAYGHDVEDAYR